MNRISHWIDGKVVEGTVRPRRARCSTRRPGSRRRASTSPASTRSTPPSPSARAAFPAWRATSLSRRAEVMFHLRELVDANRKEIASLLTAEHGKVLVRRPRRGRPRPGEHRVRLRHPAPAEGRLQRAGGDRRRRLLDPPAARRRRRHHAVQLPGDGADVDVRQRPGVRQHVRAQAEREGSVGVDAARRAARHGRAAAGLLQRRARRQGRRRPDPRAPRHRRRQLRRLDADRQVHLRDGDRRTASGCRRSAGPRTTCSCCPTPTSTWPPTPPCRPATARPASAAWRSASCSPSEAIADELVGKIAERIPSIKVGPGNEPDNEMGPLITGEHRDKVRGYVDGAGDRRGHGRRRRARRRARPRASSSSRRCSTTSRRACRRTTTRSSARCSASCGSTTTTRRCT